MFSVLLFLLLSVAQVSGSAVDCSIFDTHAGATYSLAGLQRGVDQFPYQIQDGDIPCTTIKEKNYTYQFNICGPITKYPSSCAVKPNIPKMAAIQISSTATSWCYVVGYTDDSTLALLDAANPSKGVRLTYTGDKCGDNKPRKFHIDLSCADRLSAQPVHAYEESHCEYRVTMPSVFGCPLECPMRDRAVCAGKGFCDYDKDARTARCFCNKGYAGADCSQPESASSSPKNYSPALLGLIVTLFVVIALLVASVFVMWRQIAAYKEDVSHYQVLKGDDEARR